MLLALTQPHPLLILVIGIVTVITMIIALKINAFIALITAAIVVSLMAPGDWSVSISRVAEAFGASVGAIGIVIATAAVIGKCMMDSGAADRIVRAFFNLMGEKKAPVALMGSGFVLAIPVFFDTVFYLLVPLARSLHRKTKKNYLMYLLAIAAGGAITHTLVPPTPGPLAMAGYLKVDIGLMMLIGSLVAFPAAMVGIIYATLADRWMPVPMRTVGTTPDPEPLDDSQLPSLFMSLLPIVLPVLMISTDTVMKPLADAEAKAQAAAVAEADPAAETQPAPAPGPMQQARNVTAVIGNASFALMVSMAVALFLVYQQRGASLKELSGSVEEALMSGGVIILITAGGGAFGAMLKTARVGDAIMSSFALEKGGDVGLFMLLMGFGIAVLLKIAQGSSTVAMITTSTMLASFLGGVTLPYHPVYLCTAIGAGSLVGSWMNDSGFWIFAKMGGLTEVEALKSWTPLLVVLGTVSLLMTFLLVALLPFPIPAPTFPATP